MVVQQVRSVFHDSKMNTRQTLQQCRTALDVYSADFGDNRYPVGKLEYDEFRTLLPEIKLPEEPLDVGFDQGRFVYFSNVGVSYSIWLRTQIGNMYRVTPDGIFRVKW